jgi:predicted RNase H-like HicB family nuclease
MKRKRKYTVVIERDEDAYVATALDYPGCRTHAKNLDTLIKRIREAIRLNIEVDPHPLEPLEFVGIQQITV